MVSVNVMSRAQVDLINFQTMPDDDFLHFESTKVKTGRSGIKAARNLYNLFWLFCNLTTVGNFQMP
ncbi:hypothetical protein T03_14954 [Trichinella britovi]|uniref:Uncharacterized protein n=1 Tax=Trichinella britovi TaxID=45882 RepID=A0A0V1CE33_TRIBR|nr:hypothetical protein T03_14954 [Trichinella britovi]